jgi:5-methyltetrahydrofolate--homocysteine methyltransferase
VSALADRLRQGPCLLLDGALGTELIARGLGPGQPPEGWNAERPDDVRAVHRAYVEAGTEAVHTNTFGANAVRLGPHGLAGRVREINGLAVRHARAAGPAFVIGDVGPTGECLPPVGRGDPVRWRAAFAEQAAALGAAGVDALHVETMTDLREAMVALAALREAAPGLPLLVSLAFERRRRGFFTVMGDAPAPAWRALIEGGATAVGANCGIASGDMRALAEAAEGLRVVLQPNAGQPLAMPEGVSYAQPPEESAGDMAILAARCSAVGGCCGTGPAFIATLAARLGRMAAT